MEDLVKWDDKENIQRHKPEDKHNTDRQETNLVRNTEWRTIKKLCANQDFATDKHKNLSVQGIEGVGGWNYTSWWGHVKVQRAGKKQGGEQKGVQKGPVAHKTGQHVCLTEPCASSWWSILLLKSYPVQGCVLEGLSARCWWDLHEKTRHWASNRSQTRVQMPWACGVSYRSKWGGLGHQLLGWEKHVSQTAAIRRDWSEANKRLFCLLWEHAGLLDWLRSSTREKRSVQGEKHGHSPLHRRTIKHCHNHPSK